MLAENPDITWLRPWRYREGRDDLIIGIGGRREDHDDLASREAGQRGIDIDIDRSEFAQFQLQDFQIPAGIESDLVVGDPQRSLLGLREAGQGDGRDLSKPHRPGSLKAAIQRFRSCGASDIDARKLIVSADQELHLRRASHARRPPQ